MKSRYDFNGLFCPKAQDFLPPKANLIDVAGFLEACAKRLERLAPGLSHAETLAAEMRAFAANEVVAEFPEIDYARLAEATVGGDVTWFDETLPE